MVGMPLKRPPLDPKRMCIKWLLTLAFLGLGLFLIILSVNLCRDFRERSARSVELDAIVTRVEKVERSESTDYDVYVIYDYKGIQYTELYCVSTSDKWLDKVGENVKVIVDSQDPGVQVDDLIDGLFFAFFFGLPIFAVGSFTACMRGRKRYTEEYGLTMEMCEKDHFDEERRNVFWLPLLIYSLGQIAWGIYIADIDGIFTGAILLGVMVMPFAVVLLCKNIAQLKRLKGKT